MNKDTKIVRAVCVILCFVGLFAAVLIHGYNKQGVVSELGFWVWETVCFVIMLASTEIYDKMDEIENGRE